MSTAAAGTVLSHKSATFGEATTTEGQNARPNLTYNELVRLALLSKTDNRATLGQIYEFIENTYPFYKSSSECPHWKNSVRHTLCKQRQFRRLDDPATPEGKPYRRGTAVWELGEESRPTTGPSSRRKLRQLKQKQMTAEHQTRPGSVDSVCSDVYQYPYPWQLGPLEHTLTSAVDPPSTKNLILPESAMETLFKPRTSPDQFMIPHSHLEAPRPEEVGSPLSEALDGHPLYREHWHYGQEYSTNRGVAADPGLMVGGGWCDATSLGLYQSHQPATNPYMYTDGFFWYSL